MTQHRERTRRSLSGGGMSKLGIGLNLVPLLLAQVVAPGIQLGWLKPFALRTMRRLMRMRYLSAICRWKSIDPERSAKGAKDYHRRHRSKAEHHYACQSSQCGLRLHGRSQSALSLLTDPGHPIIGGIHNSSATETAIRFARSCATTARSRQLSYDQSSRSPNASWPASWFQESVAAPRARALVNVASRRAGLS